MTDFEQIERMISEAPKIKPREVEKETEGPRKTISVSRGYSGFVAVLEFDSEGKLVDISAWE